jgi:hypothetical protein
LASSRQTARIADNTRTSNRGAELVGYSEEGWPVTDPCPSRQNEFCFSKREVSRGHPHETKVFEQRLRFAGQFGLEGFCCKKQFTLVGRTGLPWEADEIGSGLSGFQASAILKIGDLAGFLGNDVERPVSPGPSGNAPSDVGRKAKITENNMGRTLGGNQLQDCVI